MRGLPALLACASLVTAVQARRPVREFRIDLDLPPEQRWSQLIRESNADGVAFNDTVWGFWNQYFASDKLVTDALYGCAAPTHPLPISSFSTAQSLGSAALLRCPLPPAPLPPAPPVPSLPPADVPLRAATG